MVFMKLSLIVIFKEKISRQQNHMQHFPACKVFKQEGPRALGRSLENDEKESIATLNFDSKDHMPYKIIPLRSHNIMFFKKYLQYSQ